MPCGILLTGADGFTGQHFAKAAQERGYSVLALQSDLTDIAALEMELADASFDYVVHLAGISAVTHTDLQDIYAVNLFGTLNLLNVLTASLQSLTKVILVSSANVYGRSTISPIDETVCPAPVNHYAMSKLAMEHMARAHHAELPLLVVRPFNYTGVGHDERFVIPKMVNHFARGLPEIELGNMQVEREFNDVRTIVQVYLDLLERGQPGETYNVCSGRPFSLETVLAMLGEITGHSVTARVNPDFVRSNELQRLCGNPAKLEACIGNLSHPPLECTLEWMLSAARP
jgi:nucleoside-diphosphate-sugar epimerase